jgi:hypothetical protein
VLLNKSDLDSRIDIDELITILETFKVENVGKLIHSRDLFILRLAKKKINEKEI